MILTLLKAHRISYAMYAVIFLYWREENNNGQGLALFFSPGKSGVCHVQALHRLGLRAGPFLLS